MHETQRPDVGTTTEAAALVTYLLGALSWSHPQLAVAALLAAKRPLHRFATHLVSDRDVTDALTQLVVAFVILPALPNRPLGPYGALNPERVWLLVIAVTLIGWTGYVAARALGKRFGLLVSGLAGGFVSATATIAVLARQARRTGPVLLLPAALAANVATLVLLVAVTTVANPAMSARIGVGAAGVVVVLGGEIGWLLWQVRKHRPTDGSTSADDSGTEQEPAQRPMWLWAAIGLAVLLVTMLVLTKAAAAVFGSRGVVAAAAIGGLADAHASSLAAITLVGHSISAGIGLAAVGAALAATSITHSSGRPPARRIRTSSANSSSGSSANSCRSLRRSATRHPADSWHTYSPAAVAIDPATTPAITMTEIAAPLAATPTMRLAVNTRPSFAPSTAARSHPAFAA